MCVEEEEEDRIFCCECIDVRYQMDVCIIWVYIGCYRCFGDDDV